MRLSALALPIVGLLAACGQTIPTFAPVPFDSGIECTSSGPPIPAVDAGAVDGGGRDGGGAVDAGPPPPRIDAGPGRSCAMGQVCLAGHCYVPCTMDAQCADQEMCAMGVCAPRGGPHDGGPDIGPVDLGTDAGPVTPCTHVTCGGDGGPPACNPVTGTCVDCAAPDGCMSATAPVCDLAQGVCRPFVAALCAPCKVNADCAGIIPGTTFECTMHTAPNPFEKVCLPLCGTGGTCPTGMSCGDTVHCTPRVGTCTTWFAAAGSRTCTVDGDCAPLGATSADFLFPGVCSGGHCQQPCGVDADCQSASQTCPTMTFCM